MQGHVYRKFEATEQALGYEKPATLRKKPATPGVPSPKRVKLHHYDDEDNVEHGGDQIEVPRRRKRDVLKQVSMRLFMSAQGYTTSALRSIFVQRMDEVELIAEDATSTLTIPPSKKTSRKHLWQPVTRDDTSYRPHSHATSTSSGINVNMDFFLSRVTDPTSYFYRYRFDAETEPKKAHVVLVCLSWLKPHEEIVSWERVDGLKKATIKWDAYTEPLLVDVKTGAILDGHHRYTVGLQLQLKLVPAVLVDYLGDDQITVDVWPGCGRTSLTKQEVIDMSLSPNVFPPKTSRHRFTDSLPPISVPLVTLRSEPNEGTLGYGSPTVALLPEESSTAVLPRTRKRDFVRLASIQLVNGATQLALSVVRGVFRDRFRAIDAQASSTLDVVSRPHKKNPNRSDAFDAIRANDPTSSFSRIKGRMAQTLEDVMDSSNKYREFFVSRITDPTSYFYKYRFDTERERSPKRLAVALVLVSWLKPHEQIVSEARVDGLRRATLKWDAYLEPLLVDRKTGAILDGHHRYTVGVQLGLVTVPAVLVDYLEDDSITVDVWPDCGRDTLTKQDVIAMALSDDVFPPKTSRHAFSDDLPPIKIALERMRQSYFDPSVTLHTTLGDIKIEVFCDTVPTMAENFLALCASNAYDKTVFHRNMKGFMIQGGDPTGTGKGGDSIWGGKFNDEFHPQNRHNARGIVSMANSGPNTNKQQFFITYAKQPHLNNVYSVFGKVIDGFEVLDAMEKSPVDAKHRPLKDIVLQSITIHANPLAD
ncbi:hypothetical protein ACHHYP_07846 [Achlya hypogyna]|uniref:peptidylprolyl isomerase n=1 Tax=Achlya hypogyna TaxID=1202772 RepID=A0A1V9ZLD8_ACHHY|nr:hypothetical protein ACHHYP_07846 [Achlya hypogyna]